MSRINDSLARRRVPLGFACAALVFALAAPTPATIRLGAAIAALGEAIRIWAAGHVKKASEVTASGPYRWTAHPLYVGSSLMGIGLAIASASVVASVLIAIYLAATLTAAVKREETFLRDTFGERYERYRSGDAAARDRPRAFSVAQAIANHEHRAVMGLVVAVLLLALKAARVV